MAREKRTSIEELTWPEIRDSVAGTSKELANIIDEISPSKEFTVFKVRYPFGMKILDRNVFYLPSDLNSATPITEHENNNIKNKLSYGAIPLGIITKNSAELFHDIHRKIFSIATFGKGLEIGICEHLGHSHQYSISSGARSIYMLPKISETISSRTKNQGVHRRCHRRSKGRRS